MSGKSSSITAHLFDNMRGYKRLQHASSNEILSTDNIPLGSNVAQDQSEKVSQDPVNVPPRSTSQQLPSSSIPAPPPDPEESNENVPSPRRGSKRSLITRSRQGSRSSRRSARYTSKAQSSGDPPPPLPQNHGQTSPTSQKKPKSGGFLAFLNCCSRDDDTDVYKSEEPDVPAKQRKIESTPQTQRAAVPDEPNPAITSEKPNQEQPVQSEKTEQMTVPEDKPIVPQKSRENSRPSVPRNELTHDKVTVRDTPAPQPAPVITNTPLIDTKVEEPPAESSNQAETVIPVNKDAISVTQPEVPQPQLEFPPPPREESKETDVDMIDVPPVEKQDRLDEPEQPNDVKPVTLPPPPPLEKRIQQTQAADVPPVPEPVPEKQQWLLPPAQPPLKGRKCLILDLDETLVHSSFKILNQADFTIPVEIEGQYHNVYVIKRPGVDQFMKRVGELYEVVVFTASVSKYGDPLLDQLDIHHVVHHRLFRESCYNHQGNYVKVSQSLMIYQ